METLTRFDIAEYNGMLMVVIESHLLPPDPSVVVIPLLRDYPAIRYLNPEIDHDGMRLILGTRLIVAVRRAALRKVGHIREQGDRVTRAVDILMSGL